MCHKHYVTVFYVIKLSNLRQKNGSIKQESKYDNGKLLNEKCWDKSGNKIDCDK